MKPLERLMVFLGLASSAESGVPEPPTPDDRRKLRRMALGALLYAVIMVVLGIRWLVVGKQTRSSSLLGGMHLVIGAVAAVCAVFMARASRSPR